MAFQPSVLQPTPDPAFVRELKKIDPALRVSWAQERYLLHRWVIERKISPERYRAMYWSVVSGKLPRFIEQPIFDDDNPILDPYGEIASNRIVAYRKLDLAPEYEWIRFVETPEKTFRSLDSDVLYHLRREYAWNYGHSYTREKIEKAIEEAKARDWKNKVTDIRREAIDQVKHEQNIRTMSRPMNTLVQLG